MVHLLNTIMYANPLTQCLKPITFKVILATTSAIITTLTFLPPLPSLSLILSRLLLLKSTKI